MSFVCLLIGLKQLNITTFKRGLTVPPRKIDRYFEQDDFSSQPMETLATIKLLTGDEPPVEFTTTKQVICQSVTISDMLGDVLDPDAPIPLPNIKAKTLPKILEYCEHHLTPTTDKTWDQNYCKVPVVELFDIILAANYLDIKGLLDLVCRAVGDLIKGKTPEQIRETFRIPTPVEDVTDPKPKPDVEMPSTSS
jgi:hypothetical protein